MGRRVLFPRPSVVVPVSLPPCRLRANFPFWRGVNVWKVFSFVFFLAYQNLFLSLATVDAATFCAATYDKIVLLSPQYPPSEKLVGAVIHKHKKVGTRCRSPFYERFSDEVHPSCNSPNTSHGASRLVQAMSAWLVKAQRAPSRHSRDARVYGHTATAMHNLSTPPPPQS